MDSELLTIEPRSSSFADIEVSPALQNKQQEWSELLEYDEIVTPPILENRIRDRQLRCQLAGLYYMDAVKGRDVDFPQSKAELWCYKVSRSSRFLAFLSAVVLMDMVLPFATQPFCAWSSDHDHGGEVYVYPSSDASRYLDRGVVWTMNVCSLCVYYFDLSIRFYAGYAVKNFLKDRWLLFRLCACIALMIDYWGSHGSGGVYTVSTACIPFIYISRRHSLRKIVEGVIFAATKCVDVFLLVLFLCLLWSLVGFLIFRNVDTPDDLYSKFDTIQESIFMCLQTFATRSFLPFVLKPYYEVNPASTLFFVSLVIVTDLLCTALIIATGNRQYRVHANNVFAEQLMFRKQGVLSAFQLLSVQLPSEKAEEEGEDGKREEEVRYTVEDLKRLTITRQIWLQFCRSIPSTRVSLTDEKIHMIFNLESHKSYDTVDLSGFFKLCALLDAKFSVKVHMTEEMKVDGDIISSLPEHVQAYASRNTSVSHSDSFASTGSFHHSKDNTDSSLKFTGIEAIIEDESSKPTKRRFRASSIFDATSGRRGLDSGEGGGGDGGEDSSSIRPPPRQLSRSMSSKNVTKKRRRSVVQTQNKKEELLREQIKNIAPRGSSPDNLPKTSTSQLKESFWRIIKIIQAFLRIWLAFTVSISTERFGIISVNIFDTIVVVMRLFLILTLIMISNKYVRIEWFYFWWVLEVYFWGEMIFLLLACGWKKYIKDRGLGIPLVVNVASLILMSSSYPEESRSGVVYIVTVLIQSIRMPSLIMQYKAASVFNSIIPLVFRVVFIIFSCIYFFSALSFNRFCDALDADLVNAEIEAGVDDFISPWVTYSQQLNFRTFGGSLFTVFEISILGNWSSIMNSARLKESFWSTLFFFSFRLIMQLCMYPILNSFIIAAYIARKDLQSKEQEAQDKKNKEALMALREKSISEGMGGADVGGGDIELGDLKQSVPDIIVDGQNKLEIVVDDNKADSMISFWSVSGTERYVPQKPKMKPEVGADEDASELQQLRQEIKRLRDEVEIQVAGREDARVEIEILQSQLKQHHA